MFYFPPVGDIHLEISLSKLVFHAESTGKTFRSIAHTIEKSEWENLNSIKINDFYLKFKFFFKFSTGWKY